jgi:hypothetical protein
MAVTPGGKEKLTLRGKHLDTVKDVTVTGVDGATAKVLRGKKTPPGNNQPGERLGDTEAEVELTVPKGAKPGQVKLVAAGPGGESAAYALLVPDDTPVVAEKEPNDGFDQAQTVPVPAAVHGTIRADRDADVYRFEGKKGVRVKVEVQAARFGSPVDALVTVYDAGRRVLAAADDTDGSPDPALTVTLPRDGAYFVTVIDAHDLGGPQFGYRLVIRPEK